MQIGLRKRTRPETETYRHKFFILRLGTHVNWESTKRDEHGVVRMDFRRSPQERGSLWDRSGLAFRRPGFGSDRNPTLNSASTSIGRELEAGKRQKSAAPSKGEGLIIILSNQFRVLGEEAILSPLLGGKPTNKELPAGW